MAFVPWVAAAWRSRAAMMQDECFQKASTFDRMIRMTLDPLANLTDPLTDT